METLLQDLRYGLRMLVKNPGFTAVAVLTLALGIGANTAMFTVIDSVLLRPLPYRDADRLVLISAATWLDYVALRDRSHLLDSVAGYQESHEILNTSNGSQGVTAEAVTANLLDLLGVQPILGRPFLSSDNQPGAARVAILGARLWREDFSSDPHIVGRQVRIANMIYTVVGVMPDGFRFPHSEAVTALSVWLAFQPSPDMLSSRNTHFLTTLGMLKPNASLQGARSELGRIAEGIRQEDPQGAAGLSFTLRSYRNVGTASVRPALLALTGALFLVLVIACVNVANLQLARHFARRQELAVRAALGAGRGGLLRHMVAEGGVLSVAGAVAGLQLAALILIAVHRVPPNVMPRADEVQLRVPVIAMLMVFATVATILSSLAPALLAARTRPEDVLREASGGASAGMKRSRLSAWTGAGEVVISGVLLVSTGLMFRTLYNLQHIHFGFDLQQITTFMARPGDAPGIAGFVEAQKRGGVKPSESIVSRVYEPIRARLRQLPGVVDVAFSAWMPFDNNAMGLFFQIPRHPVSEGHGENVAQIQMVSSGYAHVMGTRLIQGRTISDDDTADTPFVATVNETFVRRFLPDVNPLGWQIDFRNGLPPYTIVGVLGDATQHDLLQPTKPEVVLAYRQIPTTGLLYFVLVASGTNYALRTQGNIEFPHAVREVFRRSAPEFALEDFRTLRVALDNATFSQRLGLYLTGSFAAVAVLMVLAGLYGVLSQLVILRRREIGIRMALGAQKRSILRMILRPGLILGVAGLAVGLPASLAAGRLLRAFLYGVGPTDPLTYVAIAIVLLALSITAAVLPALRATKVDPMVALRYE